MPNAPVFDRQEQLDAIACNVMQGEAIIAAYDGEIVLWHITR